MKRIIALLCLSLLLCINVLAQERPRVGLVLSGGGAKGAAHIGVLKVLEEYDIPIDYIVGASIGAIMGGLYASGYTAAELDSLMMSQDWRSIMLDFDGRKDSYLVNVPLSPRLPSGLVEGRNVEALLERLIPSAHDSIDFNSLPIPFSCVAVDLVHKKEVVCTSGDLVEAIRASMSIPLFFDPVRRGSQVMVDGGMLNNYPVDVVRAMGADVVIGVKLGEPEYDPSPEIENVVDVAGEWLDMYLRPKTEEGIRATDIFIGPSVGDLGPMSFSAENTRFLIENGVKAAHLQDSALMALKERCGLGGSKAASGTAVPRGDVKAGPSRRGVRTAVSLGGYFDSEEIVAIRARLGLNSGAPRGFHLDVGAKLAWNLIGEVSGGYRFCPWLSLDAGYRFRNSNSNLFSQENVCSLVFRQHTLSLALNASTLDRRFKASLGARTDTFMDSSDEGEKLLRFFADLSFDNRDDIYFPTRGVSLGVCGECWYFMAPALNAHLSAVLPMGRRFALIASGAYRGVRNGEGLPYYYANCLGGVQQGRYLDQQMTFVGFNHVCFVDSDLLATASLDARVRIGSSHYVTASGGYAYARDLSLFGARLAYACNTPVGPVSCAVNWSPAAAASAVASSAVASSGPNPTGRLGLYLSLGLNL